MGGCTPSRDALSADEMENKRDLDSPPASPFDRYQGKGFKAAGNVTDLIRKHSSEALDAEFSQIFDGGKALQGGERCFACEHTHTSLTHPLGSLSAVAHLSWRYCVPLIDASDRERGRNHLE